MKRLLIISAVLMLASATAQAQQSSILNSKHNLSASGPGSIRASNETEVCIFCHTPHNSAPVTPLWNRSLPVSAYTVYTSNSLDAIPGQPTGSSKLCLSCHDGTIALGSVLSRQQGIAMAGGVTTLPPGASNLGTDLSDDHPISFRYDTVLAAKDTKLRQPQLLPQQIKLDHNSELQCTSCHDAHNNQFGNFLVMDNAQSQLCNSCHNAGKSATIAEHQNCNSCHKTHTAPSGPYLLAGRTVSETCDNCHGAGAGATNPRTNIAQAMNGISKHDTNPSVTLKTNVPNDIACNDCHQSHTMENQTASAPNISPKLGQINGINASGAAIPTANYEYEVCFKCHANPNSVQPFVNRQITQTNTLLQFARAAVSFHPVEGPGKNSFVPSLKPGLTTSSTIYCTSCHSSDTSSPGISAAGPHGSNIKPLLIANYVTTDMTAESADAYALCYSCHERGTILGNQSFTLHSTHIVDNKTPCSVCHDAHGISSAQGTMTNNAHLINFDTSVVTPDTVTGKLAYETLGNGQGTCTLTCHGVPHSPKFYGPGSVNVMAAKKGLSPARPGSQHPTLPAPVVRPPTRY